MLRSFVFLAIASAAYGAAQNQVAPLRIGYRILGGHEVNILEKPYIVVLHAQLDELISLCGGSILSETKILTAAHCVQGPIVAIRVRAGSNYAESGGHEVATNRFTTHPKFNLDTLDYDVAVLHLDEDPLPLDSLGIRAVNLAPRNYVLEDDTTVLAVGWGALGDGADLATALMEVAVKTIPRKKCKREYKRIKVAVTDRMICASVPEGGKDACQGDSGGPLLTVDGLQVGVVSFGKGCGEKGYAGIYANVAVLRDWIEEVSGV